MSVGSSSTSADIVKYKAGGLVINNNENNGTTGFISFGTTPDGGSSAVERLRLDSDGLLGLNVTPSYSGLFGGSQKGLHVGGTTAPFVRLTSSTSGQGDLVLQAGNSSADVQIGSITAGGALSGVTTLTTTSTATIGGDTSITGNLRSDTSADGIQIDATDGSASNAGDLILLDGTDGSATNAGSSLLYEDGTGDPANYFNNNIKFSGDVKVVSAIKLDDNLI